MSAIEYVSEPVERALGRDVGADVVFFVAAVAFIGGVGVGVAASTGGAAELLLLLVPVVGASACVVAVLSAETDATTGAGDS